MTETDTADTAQWECWECGVDRPEEDHLTTCPLHDQPSDTPEYDATDTYQDAIEVLEKEVIRRSYSEGREACRAARRILLSGDGRADAPPIGGYDE